MNCIGKALSKIDTKLLSNALSSAISQDPSLINAIANQQLLEKLNLSPEQQREALINSMKSNESRSCLCVNLIKMDKVINNRAIDYIKIIKNDERNKNNKDLMDKINSFDESKLQISNLDDICKIKSIPYISDYVENSFISILRDFNQELNKLTPDESKNVLSSCMNDPNFIKGFNANNPELKSKLDEITNDANLTVRSTDFLNGLNLTSNEMRELILNGVNSNSILSDFVSESFAKIDKDDINNALINKIVDKVSLDGNEEQKNKLKEITERSLDSKQLLNNIMSEPIFNNLIESIIKNNSGDKILSSSNDKIKDIFNQIKQNPELSKALIDANPNLKEEFSNQNDTEALFDPVTGLKINPNTPINSSDLRNLSSITKQNNFDVFSKKPELILNDNNVKNSKTNEVYKTLGDLINNYGKSLFDKSLTREQAAAKRSASEVKDNVQQLNDLEATKANIFNTGDNKNILNDVKNTENKLLNNIKDELTNAANVEMSKSITATCKN